MILRSLIRTWKIRPGDVVFLVSGGSELVRIRQHQETMRMLAQFAMLLALGAMP